MSSFIDGRLFDYYNTILTALTGNTSVPVILHAYDHPIPDGRGDSIRGIEIGPWLYPYFHGAGYKILPFPTGSADLELGKEVMKQLIDRLNAMVTRVAAAYPNVHHVNLTGTLAKAYGTDYARLWNNELHPKGDGFDLLGKLIETKLNSLGVLGNPKDLGFETRHSLADANRLLGVPMHAERAQCRSRLRHQLAAFRSPSLPRKDLPADSLVQCSFAWRTAKLADVSARRNQRSLATKSPPARGHLAPSHDTSPLHPAARPSRARRST